MPLLEGVSGLLEGEGVDLARLGVAWARVTPLVTLVPALGLRGLPAASRASLGLLLAACVAPAVTAPPVAAPWVAAMVASALSGVPVAIAAALPLWAATVSGVALDVARGGQEGVSLPVVEGRTTPFGALFGLLAAAGFVASGGPARVALSLVEEPASTVGVWGRVALTIVRGIDVAIAVAAPVIAAALVVDVALALISRAASPVSLSGALAPARPLLVLLAIALVLGRVAPRLLSGG